MSNPNLSIRFACEDKQLELTLNRYVKSLTLGFRQKWAKAHRIDDLDRVYVTVVFSLTALGTGDTNGASILMAALIKAQDVPLTANVTMLGRTAPFKLAEFLLLSITGEDRSSDVEFTTTMLLK